MKHAYNIETHRMQLHHRHAARQNRAIIAAIIGLGIAGFWIAAVIIKP